jgi:thioesterase domain-containing protein/acyl carrier protein
MRVANHLGRYNLVRTDALTGSDYDAVPQLRRTESKDSLESTLLGWWKELLGLERVELDADFFELGGHSLIGAQLCNRIEKTCGLQLGLSALFEFRTVRQLAQRVWQEMNSSETGTSLRASIVPIQPDGSRPPVYWIPGGYGTTVMPFREVALLLGPDQPVYGFETTMPEPDEDLETIPERAMRFVKELRSQQPKGPYSFVGWCGGGYIAFEMAQELIREGQEVGFLAIVECAVPGYPKTWASKTRFRGERALWRVGHFLGRGPGGIVNWFVDRSKSLAESLRLKARRTTAKVVGRPAPPLPPVPVDIYERIWENVARYQPASYPGKTFVIIGADFWDYRGLSLSVDPRAAWRELSTGGCEIKLIPGDHMGMLEAPYSRQFANELKLCLDSSRLSGL